MNAVTRRLTIIMMVLALMITPHISAAQSNDERAQENFQAVIDGLNNNSFEGFLDAIDKKALLGRVVGAYVIEQEIRDQLGDLNQRIGSAADLLRAASGLYDQAARSASSL